MSAAKRIFEGHLNDLRDDAEREGRDFAAILVAAIEDRPSTSLTIGDLMRAPAVGVPALIERYRVQFYEWLANTAMGDAEQGFQQFKSRKLGGNKRAEQRRQESAARQAKILAAEAELLAAGAAPRGLNKRIAQKLTEDQEYIRKVRARRAKTRIPAAS